MILSYLASRCRKRNERVVNEEFAVREATNALDEVDRRRAQVVGAVSVPGWYWWAVGLLTAALGVMVDRRRPAEIAVAVPVYALVVAAATAWMIVGRGRVQASSDLLGPAAAGRIVTFVLGVVGVSLGVGFALRAAGVGHPATAATVVAGIALAGGGPLLMASLRRSMLKAGI